MRRESFHDWEPPVNLKEGGRKRFPLDALCFWLRCFVKELSTGLQMDPSGVAALCLGILCVALGRGFSVQVAPNLVHPLVLFIWLILPSGERKSALLNCLCAAIYRWERERQTQIRPLIAAMRSKRRLLEKRLETAEKQASRPNVTATKRKEWETEAADLRDQIDSLQEPPLPVVNAEDMTPEALPKLMSEQLGEFVAQVTTEGDLIILGASGRYTKEPDFNLLLKAFDEDPYRNHRAGRDPIILSSPRLCIVACIQPGVLQSMVRRLPGFFDRGFAARCLFALGVPMAGGVDHAKDGVDQRLLDDWASRIYALLDAAYGPKKTILLSLNAQNRLSAYLQEQEPDRAEFGRYGHMVSFVSRARTFIARIAAVLFMAEHGPVGAKAEIDEATLESAISIYEFFLANGESVWSEMRGTEAERDADRVLRWIKAHSKQEFRLRDLKQAFRRGPLKDEQRLTKALSVLKHTGHIRECPAPVGPGPRTSIYEVNPYVIHPNCPQNAEAGPTQGERK